MNTVIVIGCTKKKKSYECKASEMYSESILFSKTIEYIQSYYFDMPCVILSAKYGIIQPSALIAPYDVSMSYQSKDWAEYQYLLDNIRNRLKPYDKIIALCGSVYVKALTAAVPEKIVSDPMAGMGIGKRLQFLTVGRDCH